MTKSNSSVDGVYYSVQESELHKTQSIASFLAEKAPKDLSKLYTANMEVQVNAARDSGTPIEGSYLGKGWKGWTDGVTTWKSFRIPYSAKADATYNDSVMSWNLYEHAEAIGMTGWDWSNRQSIYVAYDFDSIIGHKGTGLSDAELDQILEAAKNIPYLTIRRSTSGTGLHFYVTFAEPVHTRTHDEHAALARAVLNNISLTFGTDFTTKVDICGGMMWVWHRKYETAKLAGLQPFTLIKQGDLLTNIPRTWHEHITVVKRKRTKVEKEPEVEKAAALHAKTDLVKDHHKLIEYLGDKAVWYADHNMLVTHTALLKVAHRELSLKGSFETLATGKEAGDLNCFMFPLRDGAWVIRRYGNNTREAPTWSVDGSGWTRCYYNRQPDFNIACTTYGGMPSKKGYDFNTVDDAVSALVTLGADENILPVACRGNRLTTLSIERMPGSSASRIKIEVERKGKEELPTDGFTGLIPRSAKIWEKTITLCIPDETIETEAFDGLVRSVISENNESVGWCTFTEGFSWIKSPLENVKMTMASLGHQPAEITRILGMCASNPWKLVSKPFQPEYTGSREWNRSAPQFRHTPDFSEDGECPHWDMILNHIGESLNTYLVDDIWARENNIITGADYLRLWIASMIQKPTEPLPYLFLYGPQNSGKSILHEALELLITGVQRGDRALTERHNAEIQGAVLCIIEETDLSANKEAYNRVKDYVTSPYILLHPKYMTPYLIKNTTHWLHASNDLSSCPVFPGDTRIVILYVGPLKIIVPKPELLAKLHAEAPVFLGQLLGIEIPKSNDRLAVRVIETLAKTQAMARNTDETEAFVAESFAPCAGNKLTFEEVYDTYVKWCANNGVNPITKIAFSKEWPTDVYPKGTGSGNVMYIGNLKYADAKTEPNNFIYMTAANKVLTKVLTKA